MKSILHEKRDRTCFLCMMLHGDSSRKENMHEHHVIYGWANRRLSEKYGLKVYLCIYHHEAGKEAVHQNAEIDGMLKEYAQRVFEEKWPEKKFVEIFGKNYRSGVEETIREKKSDRVAEFMLIEDGLEGVEW